MYPLNDNDLDRLSRDAAEQYDVDQNTSTSGWEALESRLNKELPLKEEKERRRFLFWLFFIALLAGGSLWYMLAGHDTGAGTIAHVATVPSSTNSDAKNTNPSNDATSPNAGIAPGHEGPAAANDQAAGARDQQPVTASGKKQEPVIVDEWVIGDEAADDYSAPKRTAKKLTGTGKGNKNKRTVAGIEKAPVGGVDDHSVVIGNVNDQKEPVVPPVKTVDGTAKTNEGTTKTNDTTNDLAATSSSTDTASNKADTAAVTQAVPVAPPVAAKDSTTDPKATAADTKKKDDKKDNKKVKGFEIGVVGGPDMSNVKFTHTASAGYNVGLQLGYRFSNRWSVNTGMLYTKKNYKANGEDVTKYGWLGTVDVYAMDGNCYMLDIPLNVRYDFSVNQRNRFFASTGLSTYIMKKENYDYYYKYNNEDRKYNWDSKDRGVNDTAYLFSILNLSAGFERSLNKKLSIGAEPYFKLPLSQLGHGKLDLNSYGIYFSLKYRIAK